MTARPWRTATRAKYKRALLAYVDTGGDPFIPEQLAEYATDLSQSGAAFLRAALKLYADDALARLKAQADPDNVGFI